MSVLTITNTVPDRAFAIPEVPLSQPVELPTNYTRTAASNAHRHSRTVSSSTLPTNPFGSATTVQNSRHFRVPSTTTSNTTIPSIQQSSRPSVSSRSSTQSPAAMQRQGTIGSQASIPRRSTSGRSVATNSPTSYVTLMRKQKATVWCDRAQAIDPMIAARQKAAKQRAVLEVVGNSQRTSTMASGSLAGKIRHGGVAKAPHYTAPNTIGAGVPTRLLAFDMQGEEESEGRVLGDNSMVHARTGSGKSSINSKYRSGYPRAGVSPPDGGSPAHEDIPEAGETPVAGPQKENYFEHKPSSGSEEEDSFGELKEMTGPNAKQHAMDQKSQDDLIRRGSVDERTSTMTRQRLFITNPDSD